MRAGLACSLLLGCGAAAQAPEPVANRGVATRTTPTFEIKCDGTVCLKPRFATVVWLDPHKLSITLEPPNLARNDSFYFAARGPGNVTTLVGAKLVLTVVVPDPHPATLSLDVQIGTCTGGIDRCPIPHLEPATAVITFDRN